MRAFCLALPLALSPLLAAWPAVAARGVTSGEISTDPSTAHGAVRSPARGVAAPTGRRGDSATCERDLLGACWVEWHAAMSFGCNCWDGDTPGGEIPWDGPDEPTVDDLQDRCDELVATECEEQPPGPESVQCSSPAGSCTVWNDRSIECMCEEEAWASGGEDTVLSEYQMRQLCQRELAMCEDGDDDDDDDDGDDTTPGDDDDDGTSTGDGDGNDDDDEASNTSGTSSGGPHDGEAGGDDAGLAARGCSVSPVPTEDHGLMFVLLGLGLGLSRRRLPVHL